MSQCKKCPHHVRHGQVAADGKNIEFKNRCGLKMKDPLQAPVECAHYPFQTKGFDYIRCDFYLQTFKTADQRNDAVPSSDFQFAERVTNSSITEMDLL